MQQLFSREPAFDLDAVLQLQAEDQGFNRLRMKPPDTGKHQALWPLLAGEGADQAFQILVRMQR